MKNNFSEKANEKNFYTEKIVIHNGQAYVLASHLLLSCLFSVKFRLTVIVFVFVLYVYCTLL
jgi:hypothetical protein